jgi:hypothetical protein
MSLGMYRLSASSIESEYIFPPRNYKHWQKLEKVCEAGGKHMVQMNLLRTEKYAVYTVVTCRRR